MEIKENLLMHGFKRAKKGASPSLILENPIQSYATRGFRVAHRDRRSTRKQPKN